MKQSIYFLFLFALFLMLSSCYFDTKETLSGNGNVTEESRNVSGFQLLKVSNGLDVFISQDDKENIRVVADENLMEHIRTEVNNGELDIYSDVSIRMAKSKKIYLHYKDLNAIKISSAGDVKSENMMHAGKLLLDLSSAGDLKLEVAAEEISVEISSSGNAHLSGKTGYLEASLSSAGDLYAFDLEAAKGDIQVSSAGNARVNITGEARFTCSSAGNIIYAGEPDIREINTSSAGNVRKR